MANNPLSDLRIRSNALSSYSISNNYGIIDFVDIMGRIELNGQTTFTGIDDNISLDELVSHLVDTSDVRIQEVSGDSDINKFFVPIDDTNKNNYLVYAYNDDTDVYVNGTLEGTITTGGGSLVLSGVDAVGDGDIISADKPITAIDTTDAGVTPAPFIYWGYLFAHRVDRYQTQGLNLLTYSIYADTDVSVCYTTTNDNDVSTLTEQTNFNIVSAQSAGTNVTLFETRNYFIIATKPICCYVRADGATSYDTLLLFPMVKNEWIYGCFSSDGHVLSVIPKKSYTSGDTLGYTQYHSDGNTATVNYTISSSTAYACDTAQTYTGSTFFSGDTSRLVPTDNTYLAAESQGDGDGGEMTPFLPQRAMTKYCILPRTLAWAKCISGSRDVTVTLYDNTGTLVSTQTTAGNTGNFVYDCRFSSSLTAGYWLEIAGSNTMLVYGDDSTNGDEFFLIGSETANPPWVGGATGGTAFDDGTFVSNYSHKKELIIQSSEIPGDVENMDIAIDLANITDTTFWSNASAGDLRLSKTSDGSTEMPIEVRNFNSGDQDGIVFTQYSGTLSSSSNTSIWLFWGNPSASGYANTDTYGRNAVWTNYIRVWHLDSATAEDSTGNSSPTYTNIAGFDVFAGKIGNAIDFDGSTEYGEFPDANDLSVRESADSCTLMCWAKPESASVQDLASKQNEYNISVRDSGSFLYLRWDMWGDNTGTAATFSINEWFHVAISDEAGRGGTIYKDGSSYNNYTTTDTSSNSTAELAIATTGYGVRYLDGLMQLFRLANISLSGDFVTSVYNNQNANSTFIDFTQTPVAI